jgi:hypothetical protein
LYEFDFEMLVDQFTRKPKAEALKLAERLPWGRLLPDQTIRLFQEFHAYQEIFASRAVLCDFSAHELVDLVEEVDANVFKKLAPTLEDSISQRQFTLEDLELFSTLPKPEASILLRMAQPPSDYDGAQILIRFREGSQGLRQVIFYVCVRADFFPQLFQEAWSVDSDFVKKHLKALPNSEIGPFLLAASGRKPKIIKSSKTKTPNVQFGPKEVDTLFGSLPTTKKTAAIKFFSGQKE